MREIKFRAWDMQMGRMVKVSIVEFDAAGDICNVAFHDATVNTKKGAHDRFHQRGNGDDLVLQQYTGLKDKNGKEIYEGDIIKESSGEVAPVEYMRTREASFGADANSGDILAFTESDVEIIGNIYENPELLNA